MHKLRDIANYYLKMLADYNEAPSMGYEPCHEGVHRAMIRKAEAKAIAAGFTWADVEREIYRLQYEPDNAKFWIWYNDGVVKLALKPGASIAFSYGGPTDEGYSYTTETYTHEGDYIEARFDIVTLDCDGRLDRHATSFCSLNELRSRASEYTNVLLPRWEKQSSHQRDYAAEAAGY